MSHIRYLPYLAGASALVAGVWYFARPKKATPEQREAERRATLATHGRVTDGSVTEVRESQHDHLSQQVLIYTYDVAGVTYEAAQDITYVRQFVDLHSCRLGLPATVKYEPNNPGNSIVVSETWIGLRQ